jgi:chemotaxis protein histidine kinase CheA
MGVTAGGLSIVKHRVQVFTGSVEVASELGCGSAFTVRIPMVS